MGEYSIIRRKREGRRNRDGGRERHRSSQRGLLGDLWVSSNTVFFPYVNEGLV